MSYQLTSTDLDQWSNRRDSQGQLPALVRRLIMSTVQPERIRFPAVEGVALPGLDGILTVAESDTPFVPIGKSVWEASTTASSKGKATQDFEKRTEQTSLSERASITFVFVTSRTFGSSDAWVEEMKARGDGWKNIKVIDGQDLATWLETCPGVHAWLSNEMGRALGILELSQWFDRWLVQTDPVTPATLLLAGRRHNIIDLLNELDGHPRAVERCAGSVEEVVAFIAAALRQGPGPAFGAAADDSVAPSDVGRVDTDFLTDGAIEPDLAREPEELEALLARCVVVETKDAWRRWSSHPQPQILIPLFYPESVQEAIDVGHHVILTRVAKDTYDKGRLALLDVEAARNVWADAGLDFQLASEYAALSRRSLHSLRRRIARHRHHRRPEWASDPSASLLTVVLLTGGWDTSYEGDVEVVLALTERESWLALAHALAPLRGVEDPPLRQTDKRWLFVDVIDAWEVGGDNLVPEDIEALLEHAMTVLTELDPTIHLTGEERVKFSLDSANPRRRYSPTLRHGIATTVAVLGAVRGKTTIGGIWTGEAVANRIVSDLLDNAAADRWLTVSSHLPLLAEAAPEVFLSAVENSLKTSGTPVMALFDEVDAGFGQQRSHHSPLLWALETLAFSRKYVSRTAVILAKLTELDPGGRLANRPLESLTSMLHLSIPQGAVDTSNRLEVVDAVRRAIPTVASKVMSQLITGYSSGMLIRNGPRYRAWPTPRTRSTYGDIVAGIDGLTDRLIEDASKSGEWEMIVSIIGHLTPAGRVQALDSLAGTWKSIGSQTQTELSKIAADITGQHRRFPKARWSMGAEGIAQLDEFLDKFGTSNPDTPDMSLFGWRPETIDMSTKEGRGELERRRIEVVAETAENGGFDAVRELARAVELSHIVGSALAKGTSELDEQMLDLLDANDPKEHDAAVGLVTVRAQTPGWLADQVRARPNQTAGLLLSVEVTDETLEVVDSAAEDQRLLFWSRVSPYRYSAPVLAPFVDGLLAADRPYSAIASVSNRMEGAAPVEIILAALRGPMYGTQEHPAVLQSPQYEIGLLLDQLEAAGVHSEELARLELFYLRFLTEERQPRALQNKLATDPEFFAEVVANVYRPDDEFEDNAAADTVATDRDKEDVAEESMGLGADAADSEEHRFRRVCGELLCGWHDPMPGTVSGSTPDTDLMQVWVTKAREELKVRSRAGVVSIAIGAALAGEATDEDGIWPCVAVREVLEREQDDALEQHLLIARLNQRGVTVRGPYEGGKQERKLAAKYRGWADLVRDQWPRSGKLLDGIAEAYEADAGREDKKAEQYMHE